MQWGAAKDVDEWGPQTRGQVPYCQHEQQQMRKFQCKNQERHGAGKFDAMHCPDMAGLQDAPHVVRPLAGWVATAPGGGSSSSSSQQAPTAKRGRYDMSAQQRVQLVPRRPNPHVASSPPPHLIRRC